MGPLSANALRSVRLVSALGALSTLLVVTACDGGAAVQGFTGPPCGSDEQCLLRSDGYHDQCGISAPGGAAICCTTGQARCDCFETLTCSNGLFCYNVQLPGIEKKGPYCNVAGLDAILGPPLEPGQDVPPPPEPEPEPDWIPIIEDDFDDEPPREEPG